MKLAPVLTLALVLICGCIYAEETSLGNYVRGRYEGKHQHSHSYIDTDTQRPATFVPERRNPVGPGLDLILYEGYGVFEEFGIEGRWDVQNDEVSTYFVSRLNLHRLFNR